MKNLNEINLPSLNATEMRETKGGLMPLWFIPLAAKIASEIIKRLPNGTPIY
jgi:hypothetical protein